MPIGFAKSIFGGNIEDNTKASSFRSTNNGSTSNGAGIVINFVATSNEYNPSTFGGFEQGTPGTASWHLCAFTFKGTASDLHNNKQAVVGYRWRTGGEQVFIHNDGISCEKRMDAGASSGWDGGGNPIMTGAQHLITQKCTPTDFATNFLDDEWHHVLCAWGNGDDRSAPFNEYGVPNFIHIDGVQQTLTTNEVESDQERAPNFGTYSPKQAKSANVYCLCEPPDGSDSSDINNNNDAYNDSGVGTIEFSYIWFTDNRGVAYSLNNTFGPIQPTPVPQPGGDLAIQFYNDGYVQPNLGGRIRMHASDSSALQLQPRVYLRVDKATGQLTNRDNIGVTNINTDSPGTEADEITAASLGASAKIITVKEGSGSITITPGAGPVGST
tara:strand:- start:1579 stop:2730 length:1152 start_codon:yes stop_codon:yes gene_type:complete